MANANPVCMSYYIVNTVHAINDDDDARKSPAAKDDY